MKILISQNWGTKSVDLVFSEYWAHYYEDNDIVTPHRSEGPFLRWR
jgi:hypothetical protein